MGSRPLPAKMEIKRTITKTVTVSKSNKIVFPSALKEYYDLIEVACDALKKKCKEKCDMDEVLLTGLNASRERYFRELLNMEPNATGFYYPSYEVTGRLEHGSPHICYLVRPYLNYKIKRSLANKKFGTVTKKQCF